MLDDTKIPGEAGLRPLTKTEREQRAVAMACLDPDQRPGIPDCSQSIWISLFFDGTGNNRVVDTPRSKHSNVARLASTHVVDDESGGRYAIYINGLGTSFDAIGEKTESTLGGAFGAGGEKRLQYARDQFDKRIVKAKARATNPKQPIRLINVSLFGFSRGAALARAFAVRLASACRQQDGADGGWRYQGYPIRLYFMGLFDTVASAGLPASAKVFDQSPVVYASLGTAALWFGAVLQLVPKDGHYAWAGNLKIPTMVEQCIHYVAAHEVRDSFPLDSVRDGKHYPNNTSEVVYPGVHSDVGGGYAPGEQTRALLDSEKLSQIPLLHMYRAARVAGVPLQGISGLPKSVQASFDLSPKTVSLFDSYQRKAQAGGPIEKATSDHLRQLYVARGYLANFTGGDAAKARVRQARDVLTQAGNGQQASDLLREVLRVNENGLSVNKSMGRENDRKLNGKTLTLREATLSMAYEDVSLLTGSDSERQTALNFFDYLVHDSIAGFGKDLSQLENWRMMYFGDVGCEPEKNRNFAERSTPTEKDEALA
ncbi:DUF2235 domain-containing protein [Burkholderia sp. S171]|uniref:T6SS phospholipase effector Tle1-like catalytic domain-containing protein n=1 Tax=Burkholderia sp. S171 TaxID=1641860 RepID=UPI00131D1C7A|nr:DUF2235 domain-containing protein [Burkholderia sp. S171]